MKEDSVHCERLYIVWVSAAIGTFPTDCINLTTWKWNKDQKYFKEQYSYKQLHVILELVLSYITIDNARY